MDSGGQASDARPVHPPLPEAGVTVSDLGVTWTVAEAHGMTPLRIWLDARDFGRPLELRSFPQAAHLYAVDLPRPPVDRLEYLVVWRAPDGDEVWTTDPGNPVRSPGVFGDHSVVEFPEYRRPAWLANPETQESAGRFDELSVGDPDSGITVAGALWSPAGSTQEEALPLLVVHDGREFQQFGPITRYLRALGDQKPELRCRALLLDPVDRDRCYSASPGYARTLVEFVLPLVSSEYEMAARPVGVGASLGAVALMHASFTYPQTFSGALLQSGSFFDDRFDSHESGFRYYDRLTRFATDAATDPSRLHDLKISMTCGAGEENLDNNCGMLGRLRAAHLDVNLTVTPDAHNYTAWRDAWDPNLGQLLAEVWVRRNAPLTHLA